MVALSKQRIPILHWCREDIESRKCCVFKDLNIVKDEVSRDKNWFNPQIVFVLTIRGGSSVPVLHCMCFMGFIYDICIVIICPLSFLRFGASGRPCLVIAAFPGYRHLYCCIAGINLLINPCPAE